MFKTVLVWVTAMGWHLWRILTLRPAFKHLSDTLPMALSFIAVYMGSGILRWVVLNEAATAALGNTLVGLVINMLAVFLVFERKGRNSALAATVLGASAVVDLLVSAAFILGLLDSVKLPFALSTVAEMFLAMVAYARFLKEPEVVRSSGYRLSQNRGIINAT